MPYFANISQRGPVKYRDVPGSIGVPEALTSQCRSVKRIARLGMRT